MLADKLTAEGYDIVKTGNADNYNYATTQILVNKLDDNAKSLAK